MQSAVISRANVSWPLLQINLHDSMTFEFIGLSNIENIARTIPEISAPQMPYQSTAFSTFTSYWRSTSPSRWTLGWTEIERVEWDSFLKQDLIQLNRRYFYICCWTIWGSLNQLSQWIRAQRTYRDAFSRETPVSDRKLLWGRWKTRQSLWAFGWSIR